MKTSEQVKQEFLSDLQAVIDKWGAEIYVRQEGMYEMPTMEVWISTVWDDNGEIVRDSADFNLGGITLCDMIDAELKKARGEAGQ